MTTSARKRGAARAGWVRAALLFLWFLASFGVAFFARELDMVVGGWPLNFWLTAQGAVLVFIAVVMLYAAYMNRAEQDEPGAPPPTPAPTPARDADDAAR